MADRSKIINTHIGIKIKELRLDKKLTQEQLSKIVNKADSTVRMWELGKSEPDSETIKILANYFKVTTDYLLGREITNNNSIINFRLKELRKMKNLTQAKLAELLNISRSTIAMYETGASEPDLNTLNKIANYFNVTLDYLLDREVIKDNNIYSNKNIENFNNNYLGEKIKFLRLQKNLSLRGLAIKCPNLTHTTISRIENGDINTSIDKVKEIANALNVSIDYLLNREEYKSDYEFNLKQNNPNTILIINNKCEKKEYSLKEEDIKLITNLIERISK
ncbi:MAG: helix-turn-helix domain-containing protein [Clostridia bacterium]|nr:helix-turn-helix domain-containing protein [Clostridia bacterium]